MSKLSYENKLEIYDKYKKGASIHGLSKEYNANFTNVRYFIKLIEIHGIDIIRTQVNKVYPKELKLELISKVYEGKDSIFNIAAEAGLKSRTLLQGWLKKYEENGYNIVERKKGRSPTMNKKPKITNNKTLEDKIKKLEKENEYLKAELEYSKKLRAVVQSRKNRQQKKK